MHDVIDIPVDTGLEEQMARDEAAVLEHTRRSEELFWEWHLRTQMPEVV